MYKDYVDSDYEWTKPSDFTLITEEDIFCGLIETVNKELYSQTDEEYHDNDVITVEIENEGYNDTMLYEACSMFKEKGEWPEVIFEHYEDKTCNEEDEEIIDVIKCVRFSFYLSKTLTT